jgi:hypothetical protein
MNRRLFFLLLSIPFLSLHADMMIGVGGYELCEKNGTVFKPVSDAQQCRRIPITEVLPALVPGANAVTLWITKGWEEEWYDSRVVQRDIIDKGYTPVFIFYWFADEISIPYIRRNEKAYFRTLRRFTEFMKKLKGQKVVIFNPEFNQNGVAAWPGMNTIFLKSYEMVREDSSVLTGLCVGDFGDYGRVNDTMNWKTFHPSIEEAAKASDFIAFQEMRGLTRNSVQEILMTPERSYAFSKYLHETYKKPTMLAYVALSTYGHNGENLQAEAYRSYLDYLPKMQEEANLLLFNTFHLYDYPGHVGYFKEAEEYFGLLSASGRPKKALDAFRKVRH